MNVFIAETELFFQQLKNTKKIIFARKGLTYYKCISNTFFVNDSKLYFKNNIIYLYPGLNQNYFNIFQHFATKYKFQIKQIAESFNSLIISGYWIGPDDVLPKLKPPYRPSAAILPKDDSSNEYLTLILSEHKWRVLSTSIMSAYRFSLGLEANEKWRFVVFNKDRKIYQASLINPIERDSVLHFFGEDIKNQLDNNEKAVLIKLIEE